MLEVMNAVPGWGRCARIADETMQMCGKSGTAQVRNISSSVREGGVITNDRLPWKQRDHALFVAFAPADNPKYAVSVVVEHGSSGSGTAGPIARDALLSAMTGGMPPLSAYPSSQRGRMETLLNSLQLRLPDGTLPATTKA